MKVSLLNKLFIFLFIFSCSSSNIIWEKNEYASYRLVEDGDQFFIQRRYKRALESFTNAVQMYPKLKNKYEYLVRLVKVYGELNENRKIENLKIHIDTLKLKKQNLEIYHYMMGKINYYLLDKVKMKYHFTEAMGFAPKSRLKFYKCLSLKGKCKIETQIYSSIK